MFFVFNLIFMFPIDFNVSNQRCFQCMFPISLLSYWTITNEEILQYYETHAKHTKRPYFCAKWFVLASLVQSGRSKRVKLDGRAKLDGLELNWTVMGQSGRLFD